MVKKYDDILAFVQKFFVSVKISSHVITSPFHFENSIDYGLRRTFMKELDDFDKQYHEFVSKICVDNVIHLLRDSYRCEYIYLKLPNQEKDTMLVIGPFTYEILSEQRIINICNDLNISLNMLDFMRQYYSSIPYVADENWIINLVRLMAESLYGGDSETIWTRRYHDILGQKAEIHTAVIPTDDMVREIEIRYQNEANFMEAISAGNLEKIEKITSTFTFNTMKQRLSDSIRDKKNLMIITNTLCRKAAQAGHVHPVYLDDISSKYALKIEYASTAEQLNKIGKDMIRKYGILVRSHSLKKYSLPIQNIINEIDFHIEKELTLSSLSEQFGLNPSYVSTLFKKETGMTLTAYVNNKRMEHAIYLLNVSTSSIQDIAIQCGILDINYFTKLFKKLKGMTPSEYRKMIRE